MATARPSTATAAALLLAAGLGLTAAACAEDRAREWLARMEIALAQRNYQGTFVHEHDGQTETLRVVHRATGGEPAERLVSLDGSSREFIRHEGELRTYFPERRVVLVENGPSDGLLLAELRRLDTVAAQYYRLGELPVTRVSGRVAHVVAVEPLDDLRYGYRLWIDEASAMPLKTQMLSTGGRVVEQLVFTELTLPASIPDSALQPAMDARDWRWLREARAGAAPANVASQGAAPLPPGAASWQAGPLPPGFRMTANAVQSLPGSGAIVTHMVFSDGLASVSVFVEPQRGAPAAGTDMLTSVGSSSALSTVVSGHKVTAIGEVPPDTVRAIATSLRARGQADAVGRMNPLAAAAGDFGPGERPATSGAPAPVSAPAAVFAPSQPPRTMALGGRAPAGGAQR
jgi:sigma-E factor negative regulatory protein RseB